jgi:hypothetical protein
MSAIASETENREPLECGGLPPLCRRKPSLI